MAKFKEGDKVKLSFTEGKVTYVTPPEKQGTLPGPIGADGKPGPRVQREQSYHVDCGKGVSYDANESELTLNAEAEESPRAVPAASQGDTQ